MEDIQSWWELPSIAHFCSLFRAAFDLLDFDIEELEEAILTDGLDRAGSPLLVELLVRLLQGCLPGKSITPSNLDSYLRKLFRQKCQDYPLNNNLFADGEFRHLPLRRKVEVLHALCDFRLEAEDVLDLLKNLETESLRVEPLGYDDKGSTYWYFYGTRLYREDHSLYHPFRRRPRDREKEKEDKRKKKRKKKGHKVAAKDYTGKDSAGEEEEASPLWHVQCYTEDDWRRLSDRFEGCESRLEKSLLQTLKDDFLPEIPRLFEEKEKIQQKRMMEFAPRRSSGRVQKLKEKKEEEEKRLAEELVIQEKRRNEEEEKKRLLDEETERIRLDKEKKKLELEEKAKEEELEKIKSPEEKKKLPIEEKVKKKKRKEDFIVEERKDRLQDREEDVLHERNVSQEPLLVDEVSPPKPRHHTHKVKKPHHRKHRKRSHHSYKNNLTLEESSSVDNQIVSDTSNKENNCLLDALSDECLEDEENDVPKPQVYSGRKTNNSLSSLAFSLTPATVVPEPTTKMVTSPLIKKRVKSAHMLLQTEDDLKTGMYKVLEHLRDHEDAWPFLDPVDETFAPNYYAVIRRPMYITKMESRLDSGYYSSLGMFEADFKLMMDNCKLYNGPESEYTHMAYTLEKIFAKLKTKYLETEFSSDEEIYIDMSFQQSAKRKNKKRNSTEEKEKPVEENVEKEKKKRGRQKKKVGRKPKSKIVDEVVTEKVDKRLKGNRVKEKDRSKSKTKIKLGKSNLSEEFNNEDDEIENEVEAKKDNIDKVGEQAEEEEDEDDEDEYDEPLLLVREDPYPEEDDEEDDMEVGQKDDVRLTPPVSEEEEEEEDKFTISPISSVKKKKCIKYDYGIINKWKKEPDKLTKSIENNSETEDEIEDIYPPDGDTLFPLTHKKEELRKEKCLPKHIENSPKKHIKDKKSKKGKDKKEKTTKKSKKEDELLEEERKASVSTVDISDSDTDVEGVLLYYNNIDEDSSSEEGNEGKVKKDYLSERHNELFGEIDDIEEEEKEEEEEEEVEEEEEEEDDKELLMVNDMIREEVEKEEPKDKKRNHTVKRGRKKEMSVKEKRKRKHNSEKHHHHHHNHHHHHHKSKSKEGKHHHHKRKTKHNGGKDSPSKKVLKVEEVYEYSEEDPSSRDSRLNDRDRDVPQSPILPPLGEESLTAIPEEEEEDTPSIPPPKTETLLVRKKKNRRKEKHEKHNKHTKHKEGKLKGKVSKGGKKESKRKNIKKIIKKKRKQIPIQKMAAIDALSAATEQTLKDITILLDDPEVPKFTGESPTDSSFPTHRVTSQEFESIALKIEAEYRRKLKMDPSEEKRLHKKKKRKVEETKGEESGPKKKKIKKEIVCENKEIDKKVVEKEREKKVEKDKEKKVEGSNLDNTKELFKDIKDGRIKPGAIIKSKDIAKKEGMVKKETKSTTETKPKNKQNPFGKINKQENSKLTTLIAKAKESRIGLVPNSEVGDSPKLSLGSIILFGDIGTGKHSSREPNSPDEEEKMSDKFPEKLEKWDSPWETRWEKPPCETKDEISNPPSHHTEEEEEKEDIEEIEEVSPERPIEEIIPPPTPRGPEFKQERATPNLSAWFRAFGGPKLTAAPRKKMDDDEEFDDEDEDKIREEEICPDEIEDIKEEDDKENKQEEEEEEIKVNSPDSIHENPVPSPRPPSPEPPASPQPPLSPEKPPETPWFEKLNEKLEEEPIWKKNKTEEEDDPYKFEEEELDRAREEAKKLEVERQRKASVSSSGLSDPSPLNIDSDRSPAAFSSEGERSPLTRSPVTCSPVTPGFGGTKQFSPVTEKSPNVPAYSPRFDTGLGKSYSGFEEKGKYQANGTLKVGFYQDMADKSSQDKTESSKGLEQKIKESPIYSPTVPYVSPLYSNKDQSICKQKSPGRYSSYYSSIDSSTLDKPKTPGYYSTSAPSTPTDRPSPAAPIPSEEKPKTQYSYYNYDPTKSLTDQYKNTGSNSSKTFYPNSEATPKSLERSPLSHGTPLAPEMNSPVQMPLVSKPQTCVEKADLQPPKKRQALERASHQHNTVAASPTCPSSLTPSWVDKKEELETERAVSVPLRNPFSPHPLPANLANLSQIVSRIPEPEVEHSSVEKESRLEHDLHHSQSILAKTVQPAHLFEPSSGSLPQPPSVPELHHSPLINSRADHSPVSDLSSHQNLSSPHILSKSSHLQPPPVAHQKVVEGERPGSRNMLPPPHTGEKSHGYLHQKTMWSSSLPSSIPSSLSSLVSNATMASIALAGQKGLGSFSSEHLAQFGMDRAALASLAGRSPQAASQLFSHDLLQRNAPAPSQVNPPSMASPSGLSLQPHLNGTGNSSGVSSSSGHSRSSSLSGANTPASVGSGSSSSIGSVSGSSSNFDLGLARSYASIMSASQSSPLFARSDASLTPGSLPRSLSGSSSPFLPQSPGLGAALGMPGSSRTPTPAHQQSLSQSNFPAIPRDPRDPISQSHPSLQIPSLNSIACSQAQTLSHLNAASLASYSSRDSLALMNQGGRGPLVGVDPTTPQQLYQQYLQRHQLAQEELLLRSAGHHSQLAHQSMMLQQGLMSAAAASYPSGYPHSLGLRSSSYQGMNRPWI